MTSDETIGMSEDERRAFQKGYDDFRKGERGEGSMGLSRPAGTPTAGFETAYQKGWKKAETDGIDEAHKKGHSRECWGYIAVGGILFAVGCAVTIGTFMSTEGQSVTLWYGAIVGGLVLMATGVFKYFSKESLG